jgi:hypothetical protein
MKTYENWKGSLKQYLQPGDLVDQAMVDHFVNVLPPLTMTGNLVQCSEPQGYIEDANANTYITFFNSPQGWRYAGCCFRGFKTDMSNYKKGA